MRLFNFTIPALKSQSGKTTCPFAGKCTKFCYAQKHAYVWSNVKAAHERNFEATRKDDFVERMNAEIKQRRVEMIRVHDAGDYYSPKYLAKWIQIAIHNPNVKFYSYTNSVEMIKNANLPENYDIIFSDSGKQDHLIDRSTDRHTKIFDTSDNLSTSDYADASEYDVMATKWYNTTNKVGLLAH